MSVPNAPLAAMNTNNVDMILRLERLSRQTSLVALETSLEMGEDSLSGRRLPANARSARDVASHIIRASLEMQQAARMYQ